MDASFFLLIYNALNLFFFNLHLHVMLSSLDKLLTTFLNVFVTSGATFIYTITQFIFRDAFCFVVITKKYVISVTLFVLGNYQLFIKVLT